MNTAPHKRLAMWSGPRNISTAMMYAFAQRDDCVVWDEPFYAAYLQATGLSHPMRDEIIAAGIVDAANVIGKCVGPASSNMPVFYQKHMTQHMIPEFERDWILNQTNVFLIRHPARVLASYSVKRENPTLDDIGFRQQLELVDLIRQQANQTPLIVDSADIRDDPKRMLQVICAHIDIAFDEKMLSWPKGGHPQDGVWASHWYGAVWKSTGFAGPETALPSVPDDLGDVYDAAKPIYDQMAALKTTG